MDIERLATSAVKECLSYCDGISPFINDGDKEPAWDGHIYVYPNNKKEKLEMLGRIPVQVKGKKVDKLLGSTYKFTVEVSDLKKYANDGGVIYFVVTRLPA